MKTLMKHPRAKPHREQKRRISSRVRAAVRLMVEAGRSRHEAAKMAGIQDDTLYRALKRTDVLAFRSELMQVLRSSAAAKSIARIDALATDAISEHVRLSANELLLGLDGYVPLARSEGRVIHEHTVRTPGLVIIRHTPNNRSNVDQQPRAAFKLEDKTLELPVKDSDR